MGSMPAGKVPRATFGENVCGPCATGFDASTVTRTIFAFLYVASHGGKAISAVLPFSWKTTASMTSTPRPACRKVEQFVGALENAIPIDQLLLFDCCRTPTDIRLPWERDVRQQAYFTDPERR